MEPLISLIIPAYQVENYIGDCIASVCKQTYSNLEIIVVDDGSTDATGRICDQWAEKDARVRVIHQTNAGPSSARNRGLNQAKGEYLAFVDSDDLVLPDFVESLYNVIEETGKQVAMCQFTRVEQNYSLPQNDVTVDKTKTLDNISDSKIDVTDNKLRTLSKRDLFYIMADVHSADTELIVVVWNKIYARNLWNNLRYSEGKLHEDQMIMHELLNRAGDMAYIEKKLYCYRQRVDSIMSQTQQFNLSHLDEVEAYHLRANYYRNQLESDLARELFPIALNSYFEKITMTYHLANQKEIANPKANQLLREKMQQALKEYASEIGWKKKLRFLLFLKAPALYERHYFRGRD